MIEAELKALSDLAEEVLMAWLAVESSSDKRRQQALALLADAGMLLFNAHRNLTLADDGESVTLKPRQSKACTNFY